jgi:hypothetical protein
MMRRFPCLLLALLLAVTGRAVLPQATSGIPIQATHLEDGVVLWTPKETATGKSFFFRTFEDLAQVVLPSRDALPFDRSIAFLVGVSNYRHLRSLPFVRNDLQDMKNYLLQQGGFDQVYVVEDESVSNALIESYMMNKFPADLRERDRLLFYYAGHGADAQGRTGYLLFANAQRGDFARHVLAVSRVLEWGRVNRARHMLFLLDACSSGLAFTARGVARSTADDDRRLVQTMSGRGSRTVVTAGTADEETFEVMSAGSKGNGVFTRALLTALEQGKAEREAPPFLTIGQVVADLQVSVAKFAAENRKSLNPRLWTFDDDEYRGSFLFLNPAVRSAPLSESRLLQVRAKRGDSRSVLERAAGAEVPATTLPQPGPPQPPATAPASTALAPGAKDPEIERRHLRRAQEHFEAGDCTAALRECEEGLRIQADSAQLRELRDRIIRTRERGLCAIER